MLDECPIAMFDTAFDEWEKAERAANDAWAAVLRNMGDLPPGLDPAAADPDITTALRLRRRALLLLHDVQQELRASREKLPIL